MSMEGKKSFLLYCDQIGLFKKLPDEQAGKLIKIIFEYVNDLNPEINDVLLDVAFDPIKLQLKRDLQKWEGIKDDRSNSGKLGNLKRWHPKIYDKVVAGKITLDEGLSLSQMVANGRTAIKGIANIAVNDTVTVNDTKDLEGEFTNSPLPLTQRYRKFIEFFNMVKLEETGRKGQFKGDSKSENQFKVLIKQHKSEDIGSAIRSMFRDKHHKDNGYKYATPELITRPDKFARFLEMS